MVILICIASAAKKPPLFFFREKTKRIPNTLAESNTAANLFRKKTHFFPNETIAVGTSLNVEKREGGKTRSFSIEFGPNSEIPEPILTRLFARGDPDTILNLAQNRVFFDNVGFSLRN